MDQRITIVKKITLLDGWSKVIRVMYRQLRKDGTWQQQDRDMLDRGDGITVLLCNPARRTVLLLKQARVIATIRGAGSSQTIEACNGLIEDESPRDCALREVQQETGHSLKVLTATGSVYSSPGASLEIVHLFVGEYGDDTRVSNGGGLFEEGEDIELMEVAFEVAMRWIVEGRICDARTVILLQHVALHGM